jgi:hypothetical protein
MYILHSRLEMGPIIRDVLRDKSWGFMAKRCNVYSLPGFMSIPIPPTLHDLLLYFLLNLLECFDRLVLGRVGLVEYDSVSARCA